MARQMGGIGPRHRDVGFVHHRRKWCNILGLETRGVGVGDVASNDFAGEWTTIPLDAMPDRTVEWVA